MYTIDGILLAGGLSSRMGQDKALLRRDHRDMFFYILDTMEPLPLKNILISRNQGQIQFLTRHQVIQDIYKQQGPLGGIFSVLQKSHVDGVLIVPVDLPLIETIDLNYLLKAGSEGNNPVHFDNHYLPLYLPNTQNVRQYLKDVMDGTIKNRSIRNLCRHFNAVAISPKDEDRLSNANTPDQWRDAEYAISII